MVGTKLDLAGDKEEIRKARHMGKDVVTFRQVKIECFWDPKGPLKVQCS